MKCWIQFNDKDGWECHAYMLGDKYELGRVTIETYNNSVVHRVESRPFIGVKPKLFTSLENSKNHIEISVKEFFDYAKNNCD